MSNPILDESKRDNTAIYLENQADGAIMVYEWQESKWNARSIDKTTADKIRQYFSGQLVIERSNQSNFTAVTSLCGCTR